MATTSSFIYNMYKDKNTVVKESIKLAKVSGKNIAASLMFADRDSANSILRPILNDKNVHSIKIYDNQGRLFTTIGNITIQLNNWIADEFVNYPEVSISTSWDYIDILTSITHAGENIGYLQIISNTNAIKKHIIEQIFVSLTIVLFTFVIIFILAFWFEKIFSKPLYDLLNAMRQIKNDPASDIYLPSHTKDEFHELYTEFNRMTNEIKKRDNILKEHNIDLKKLVSSTNEELKKTKSNLNEVSILATTDPLTNLSNRRNTMDQFDLLIKDAQKEDKPLGVIMLDIDHFKQVNDNLGHQAGDIVLKNVAQHLLENARDNDVVGRIGGEEFLILCQHADMDTTYKVAERIRHNVEQQIISYEKDKSTQVTISMGLCSTIPALNTKEELIKIVDDALYKAKRTGRNKVIKGFVV
ncbi:MAG: diguanylate cyclase [gamma proteobacterium symbiont of Taylorina sp.]|nr:diguanylate cyclase [gamma proteobacterium symbiont of Taylorina sp.]